MVGRACGPTGRLTVAAVVAGPSWRSSSRAQSSRPRAPEPEPAPDPAVAEAACWDLPTAPLVVASAAARRERRGSNLSLHSARKGRLQPDQDRSSPRHQENSSAAAVVVRLGLERLRWPWPDRRAALAAAPEAVAASAALGAVVEAAACWGRVEAVVVAAEAVLV